MNFNLIYLINNKLGEVEDKILNTQTYVIVNSKKFDKYIFYQLIITKNCLSSIHSYKNL